MRPILTGLTVAAMILSGAARDSTGQPDGGLLETVHKLLASDAYPVKAWGAYIAGRHDLKAAAPRVRTLLRPLPDKAPKEAMFVHYAALDALIRLEAEVPPAELLALPDRFRTHAYLILMRKPEKNRAALLDLIRPSGVSRPLWLAVAKYLAPMKEPGLAAVLLGKFRLKIGISVLHDHSDGSWSAMDPKRERTHGRFSVPPGYPPTTLYHLKEQSFGDFKMVGYELAASGELSVYICRRVVQPGKTAGFFDSVLSLDHSQALIHILAQMSGMSFKALARKALKTLLTQRTKRILWSDPETFKADVAAIRKSAREDFMNFARIFQAKGLLTEEDARGHTPIFEIKVSDFRKDKTQALPPIPPAEAEAAPPSKKRHVQGEVRIGDIYWFGDYDRAVRVARKEGKPLLRHFGENPG